MYQYRRRVCLMCFSCSSFVTEKCMSLTHWQRWSVCGTLRCSMTAPLKYRGGGWFLWFEWISGTILVSIFHIWLDYFFFKFIWSSESLLCFYESICTKYHRLKCFVVEIFNFSLTYIEKVHCYIFVKGLFCQCYAFTAP